MLVFFRECSVQQEVLHNIVNHDRVKWLGLRGRIAGQER